MTAIAASAESLLDGLTVVDFTRVLAGPYRTRLVCDLDAAALRSAFPELVHCSISGFGQTGPLSSMQAYTHLINAISGMMDLDRDREAQHRAMHSASCRRRIARHWRDLWRRSKR